MMNKRRKTENKKRSCNSSKENIKERENYAEDNITKKNIKKKNKGKDTESKKGENEANYCNAENIVKIKKVDAGSANSLNDIKFQKDEEYQKNDKKKEKEKEKETEKKEEKETEEIKLSLPKTHYLIGNAEQKSLLLNNISSVEENKLFVKNISEDIKKEDLHNFFKNVEGYVETRTSYNSKGKIRNFAYIQFDTKENAEKFLTTVEPVENNTITGTNSIEETFNKPEEKKKKKNEENEKGFTKIQIKNRTLLVSISHPSKTIYEPNTVFVKFTKCVDTEDSVIKEKMQQFFFSHSLEIKKIRIMGKEEDKHGYIELENNEDVIKCVEEIKEGATEDFHFTLNYSIPLIKKKIIYDINKMKLKREREKALKEDKKKEENSSIIVVTNLNYNTRKHKLQSLFGKIGEIEKIYLSKKVSENNIKRNKGFAYITFKNKDDAMSALILNGTVLDGRSIMVSKYLQGSVRRKRLNEEETGYSNDYKNNVNNINNTYKNVVRNEKGKLIPSNYNISEANTKYFSGKKRINLSKETAISSSLTENYANDEGRKRSDNPDNSMTNEDFRKMFIK